MAGTPGQFLEIELNRLGVDKTDLAKRLGVKYTTVLDWTMDRGGFNGATKHNQKNRRRAAEALGLGAKHFDKPTATMLHQKKCRKVLDEFLASPLAPTEPPISETELANLRRTFPPLDRYPTKYFYSSYLFSIRDQVTPANAEADLEKNEAVARSLEMKLKNEHEAILAAKQVGRRKAPKRAAQPRSAHR